MCVFTVAAASGSRRSGFCKEICWRVDAISDERKAARLVRDAILRALASSYSASFVGGVMVSSDLDMVLDNDDMASVEETVLAFVDGVGSGTSSPERLRLDEPV